MPKTLERVKAVGATKLPDEQYLGWLATYSMPDEPQSGAKVMRTFAKHGLDVNYLPEARQPVHVFQSACATVRSRRSGDSNLARQEIAADEVENNGVCSYQITVRTWDRANRTIEHEKAMRVVFDKQASDIKVDQLEAWDPHMAELEHAIRADFEANAKTVPGQKIRNGIRDMLLDLGAQNVRRKAGGLYFVPREWTTKNGLTQTKPILAGLKAALADLYRDDADFWTIGLVGEDEEKDMVRKHFALNVNLAVDELATKVTNRLRQGKGERGVRGDLVTNVVNERRKIAQAIAQFQKLVDVEKDDLSATLKYCDDAIGKLQRLADGEDVKV